MKRLFLVSLALGLACARPAADPGQLVALYLRSLGRDPLRAIACTTPAFQERHGLRLATSAEVARWRERIQEGGAPAPAPALPLAPPTAEEARVAWLSVQVKPAFLQELERLSWRVSAAELGDERHAAVTATIEPADAPAFQQVFHLVREAGSQDWRVDRVEQSGVDDANRAAAFAANPTDATRRRLAARLGVPAD